MDLIHELGVLNDELIMMIYLLILLDDAGGDGLVYRGDRCGLLGAGLFFGGWFGGLLGVQAGGIVWLVLEGMAFGDDDGL